MMQYLVITGILTENDCFLYCNAFSKTESSPAREENTTLHSHHNPLSLQINESNTDNAVQQYQIATLVILVALASLMAFPCVFAAAACVAITTKNSAAAIMAATRLSRLTRPFGLMRPLKPMRLTRLKPPRRG
jgi:hypothetical protein